MKDHKGPRRTMKDHEGPWRTTKDHEGPWRTMKDHEGSWRTMKVHEGPWMTMKDHVGTLRTMNEHEETWRNMKEHEGTWGIGRTIQDHNFTKDHSGPQKAYSKDKEEPLRSKKDNTFIYEKLIDVLRPLHSNLFNISAMACFQLSVFSSTWSQNNM
jgi:hypothetical protein